MVTDEMQKNRRKPAGKAIFKPGNDTAYQFWRDAKLADYPATWNESIVTLADMVDPKREEILQIINLCARRNMVIYDSGTGSDAAILPQVLSEFCGKLGLHTPELHRAAGQNGVVAIEQLDQAGRKDAAASATVKPTKERRAGYIPYTNKPLSWHTDGYYNAPQDRIRAMVLHCVRDASKGGENELLDPEIAYIRLRDENPDFIKALMAPDAMTIPANTDPRSPYRPDSVGPVFAIDAEGFLHMRYTARTRNIIWKDDDITRQACAFLREILQNDPLILRYKLQSGQGIISNNVLHNRTGFIDAGDKTQTRLLYRIRYKERVSAAPATDSRKPL